MNKIEKAALDAANIENGVEEQKSGQAINSSNGESITEMRMQGRVEALLPRGERNALRGMEIMAAIRISNTQLRDAINWKRTHGALILSTVRGHGGYFLLSPDAKGRCEIEDFIRTVNARAVNSQRILRAARRELRDCDGQEVIGDA